MEEQCHACVSMVQSNKHIVWSLYYMHVTSSTDKEIVMYIWWKPPTPTTDKKIMHIVDSAFLF
jgi:hypothetical protein